MYQIDLVFLINRCSCVDGFEGPRCNLKTNHCNNSCKNGGTCVNGSTNHTCLCLPFYTGMTSVVNYCWQWGSAEILLLSLKGAKSPQCLKGPYMCWEWGCDMHKADYSMILLSIRCYKLCGLCWLMLNLPFLCSMFLFNFFKCRKQLVKR